MKILLLALAILVGCQEIEKEKEQLYFCDWEPAPAGGMMKDESRYVNRSTGRIEGGTGRYQYVDAGAWQADVRGRSYGPIKTEEQAKRQVEKFAFKIRACDREFTG